MLTTSRRIVALNLSLTFLLLPEVSPHLALAQQQDGKAVARQVPYQVVGGDILIAGADIRRTSTSNEAQPPGGAVNINDRAYFKHDTKWTTGVVFVCWENSDDSESTHRKLVQQAITSTWEAHSNGQLKFKGWGPCQAASRGIRIAIDDSGPHTNGLGNQLGSLPGTGMVLNFTFKTWGQACQTTLEACIRSIAVHEFGHAIGFAHEQNRPDTPGECRQAPQGENGDVMLTPWDIHSVMNYCNPKYNNDGTLSDFDVEALQVAYAAPSTP